MRFVALGQGLEFHLSENCCHMEGFQLGSAACHSPRCGQGLPFRPNPWLHLTVVCRCNPPCPLTTEVTVTGGLGVDSWW